MKFVNAIVRCAAVIGLCAAVLTGCTKKESTLGGALIGAGTGAAIGGVAGGGAGAAIGGVAGAGAGALIGHAVGEDEEDRDYREEREKY